MNVTYALYVGHLGLTSEDEINSVLPGARNDLENYEDYTGQIVLQQSGQPDVVIEDDLAYLASQMGIKAIPKLLAGQPFEFALFTMPGKVLLQPEGDNVRVSVDAADQGVFPKAGLVRGLVDCAQSVAAVLQRLGGNDAKVVGTGKSLADRSKALDLSALK